jgi:NIMA (never in mitosis gene a)-related kinase
MYIEESFIWKMIHDVVKGLKVLHEMNIFHRDLKSANVFLFSDGGVKLGDLNVSK